MMRLSWTQPCCDECWPRFRPLQGFQSLQEPFRIRDRRNEVCVFCGEFTDSGIYVRVDPLKYRYSSLMEE